MSQSNNSSGGGIGILGLLFVLFVGLKLGGIITWSWWWVTAPLWGSIVLALAILIPLAILAVVAKDY